MFDALWNDGIHLVTDIKSDMKNPKNWKPIFIPFAKARKRIGTVFSQLADQFLAFRNYAKVINGLFARISALIVSQYVNYK